MENFKIGDRVTHRSEPEYGIGTIKAFNHDEFDRKNLDWAVEFEGVAYLHDCDGYCEDGHGWWCSEDDMELAEEPKRKFSVGDRVVYNKEWGIGTVKGYDQTYGYPMVEFDEPMNGHECGGFCKDGHGWLCIEDYLKLVTEPVQRITTFEITPVGENEGTVKDMVNHPDHYKAGGIETIDFMQAKLTPEGFEGYLTGNILKYLTRYNHKNGLEDLKKAQWYLDKLITVKEGE